MLFTNAPNSYIIQSTCALERTGNIACDGGLSCIRDVPRTLSPPSDRMFVASKPPSRQS